MTLLIVAVALIGWAAVVVAACALARMAGLSQQDVPSVGTRQK